MIFYVTFFLIFGTVISSPEELTDKGIESEEKKNATDVSGFYCKCNSSKEWKQLSNTPFAWLILTHDIITMERSLCLLRKIWRPHHKYVIHVDKSVSRLDRMLLVQKINEEFKEHSNVFIISQFVGGYGYELVEIELEMLRTIVRPWPSQLEMDCYYNNGILPELSLNASNNSCGHEWKYAAILSGDSYPLQDIDVIVRRISSSYGSINPFGMVPLTPRTLYRRFFKPKDGKKILKVLESAYRECGDEEKSSRLDALIRADSTGKELVYSEAIGAPVYYGLEWVVLTRNFVEYSVTSELAHKLFDVLKHISYAGDEHYFQNLLFASCQSRFIDDVVSDHSNEKLLVSYNSSKKLQQFMHTAWKAKDHILTPSLVHGIHDDVMFVRKVRSPDTEQAIESRTSKVKNDDEDFLHYCRGK